MPDLSNIYIVVLNHAVTVVLLILFVREVTLCAREWLEDENSDMPSPASSGAAAARMLMLLMISTGFIHPVGLVYGAVVIVLSVTSVIIGLLTALIDFIRYGIFTMSESPNYLFQREKQTNESEGA